FDAEMELGEAEPLVEPAGVLSGRIGVPIKEDHPGRSPAVVATLWCAPLPSLSDMPIMAPCPIAGETNDRAAPLDRRPRLRTVAFPRRRARGRRPLRNRLRAGAR